MYHSDEYYDEVSHLTVARVGKYDFDVEIVALSDMPSFFNPNLPSLEPKSCKKGDYISRIVEKDLHFLNNLPEVVTPFTPYDSENSGLTEIFRGEVLVLDEDGKPMEEDGKPTNWTDEVLYVVSLCDLSDLDY